MKYFNELVDQSINRAREATLSVLSVKNKGLRDHLSVHINNELGADGCFLAPPVFEHTFGWKSAEQTLHELSGSLLSSSLVETLDSASEYRFSKDSNPYAHQLEAWNTLMGPSPQSAVITSGTGSGKTECFMLPILDDLIREAETTGQPLIGVRALFLYPLNALINSQQERLDAWTRAYGDKIRFCLYNGMTEELATKVRADQRTKPNQVLSRESLRARPAPMLMTNSTMLEYMLVRQVDRPILEVSREEQSLRWIVLDEAHTYVGSKAAEMALLLRRVVLAFGRKASEIRFVATSATISGENSKQRLATYMAELAGVSIEQVHVIGGSRVWPSLPIPQNLKPLTLSAVTQIDPDIDISSERYKSLAAGVVPSTIRQAIVSSSIPLNLDELVTAVAPFLVASSTIDRQREVLSWFNIMTRTYLDHNSPPFLKVRCHLFQRMLHGLWACVDPACSQKTAHLYNWPFGNVSVEQRTRCGCGAPVFELSFCEDCSTPHLLAEDRNKLLQQPSQFAGDDFSLVYDETEAEMDADLPPEDTGKHQEQTNKLVIAPTTSNVEGYFRQNLNIRSSEFGVLDGPDSINVVATHLDGASCSHCEYKRTSQGEFYRRSHLGAAFYVANAVPTVLEFCPDPTAESTGRKSPEELPGRGRKLITFTDSRQGTARMAVRMQQEAERSRLRGLVFETLRNAQSKLDEKPQDVPTAEPDELLELAKTMEKMGLHSQAQETKEKAEAIIRGGPAKRYVAEMNWDDIVETIASSFDISQSILDYNKYANPAMFEGIYGSKMMARMLLAREFSRRPKRQNSLETLGLVSVGYQGLQGIRTTPQYWEDTRAIAVGRGQVSEGTFLTLDDWKDFLVAALNFHVRENTYIGLDRAMQRWMGGRFVPKVLFSSSSTVVESNVVKKWPMLRKGPGSRLVKLLQVATSADIRLASEKDKINIWLEAAFTALVNSNILEPADSGFRLNLNTLTFSLPNSGWVCPTTNKILSTAFRSLTPYLPLKLVNDDYRCEYRDLPELSGFKQDGGNQSKLKQIRDTVSRSEKVKELRSENLWTDISDRTVEGGFYYRTAEHSAQQSSKKLQLFEDLFKKGKINVLNCSTTMEMGVDIGGISAVVMNNVPPHPANYLQRSGRAGRRDEARAISYTLCKADPHNQRAFRQPKWPFITAIPAPHITLSSDVIVQRHVNSFLLATFLGTLSSIDGDRTKLTVQWFFAEENSPSEQFVDWLLVEADTKNAAIGDLVRGTALEKVSFYDIYLTCSSKIENLRRRWLREYEQINFKLNNAKDEAYKKALKLELKRHEGDYLLRDLSARAFLPGHGFPTDLVSLNTYNIEDFIQKATSKYDDTREDNIFNLKEQPSRGLNVAIREYAPGAQVVIDGRVYLCAGISLQWQPGGFSNEAQKFDIAWRCDACGSTGMAENAYANSDSLNCSFCGNDIPSKEKKLVLRPKGFLTDFYEATTNDISTQKYLKVEKPRVQLDSTEVVSFPDANCGHIRFGHQGSVFYHSSGDHEKGYAVCLTCGKSVSMNSSGEIPKNAGMLPTESHRPIGGLIGSHKEKDCSGTAVKRDVYLGYQIQTDVLEMYLRNPVNGQWLSDSNEDRVIATTLAVALRDVIADRLGILSSEMGFSTRPDRDIVSGATRSVIQLFDQVSGGAGFVMSELSDIVVIMKLLIEKLRCPRSCDNVCHHCLASQDSRVEMEQLDRIKALEWLESSQYIKHLSLPTCFENIPGASYNALGPLYAIQRAVRSSNADSDVVLCFRLGGACEDWDLNDSRFRNLIHTWILTDRLEVWLGIESKEPLTKDLSRSFARLQSLGLKLFSIDERLSEGGFDATLVAQVRTGEITHSILSSGDSSTSPGPDWLLTNTEETWVTTKRLPFKPPISLDMEISETIQENAKVLEITSELDGRLQDLPLRLQTLFTARVPNLISILQVEKPIRIKYSDRYLKSPWSALMLYGFLEIFKSSKLEEITIETVAPMNRGNRRVSSRISDDWATGTAQKEVLSKLLYESTDISPNIKIHQHTKTLKHGRTLELEFASGSNCTLIFDQGMGYWGPHAVHSDHLNYNFRTAPEHQPAALLKFRDQAICKGQGRWPTFLTVVSN